MTKRKGAGGKFTKRSKEQKVKKIRSDVSCKSLKLKMRWIFTGDVKRNWNIGDETRDNEMNLSRVYRLHPFLVYICIHPKLHFGYGLIKVVGFATYYACNNTGIFSGRIHYWPTPGNCLGTCCRLAAYVSVGSAGRARDSCKYYLSWWKQRWMNS